MTTTATCHTANLATAAHLATLGYPILAVEPEEGKPGYMRFMFPFAARKALHRYLEVRRDIHRQLGQEVFEGASSPEAERK